MRWFWIKEIQRMEEIRKAQNEYVREYDDDETLPAGVSDEGNTYTLSLNSRYNKRLQTQ